MYLQISLSLGTDLNDPYNWEVESYLSFVLFPYQYTTGMFVRCQPYEQCEKCAKCPKTDYRNLSLRVHWTVCCIIGKYL